MFWTRRVFWTRLVLGLVVVLGVSACGGSEGSRPARADEPQGEGDVSGEVIVQAAASLTDVFAELAEGFEAANPDADITVNVAGSQSLAAQIRQGAPVDVFASADRTHIDRLADEGLVAGQPEVFAANALAIAVQAGNPFDIRTLADLTDPELVVVLAAPEVPAGRRAAQALDAAGVTVTPASLENDVRSALSKVELGEADAAIVYDSDLVTAPDSVQAVAIPPEQNVVGEYPIAVLADAPNPAGAAAVVDFVRSASGQAVLDAHGFTTP